MAQIKTRWMATGASFWSLAYGEFFVASMGERAYVCMKTTYNADDWAILFADLSGTDTDLLPDLINPGSLQNGASGLRRLDGEFTIEPAATELAEAYSTHQEHPLANGSLAILADGGPALYLRNKSDLRCFDLSTGKGISRPQDVAWHRSWRLNWMAGPNRKELFTVNAPT